MNKLPIELIENIVVECCSSVYQESLREQTLKLDFVPLQTSFLIALNKARQFIELISSGDDELSRDIKSILQSNNFAAQILSRIFGLIHQADGYSTFSQPTDRQSIESCFSRIQLECHQVFQIVMNLSAHALCDDDIDALLVWQCNTTTNRDTDKPSDWVCARLFGSDQILFLLNNGRCITLDAQVESATSSNFGKQKPQTVIRRRRRKFGASNISLNNNQSSNGTFYGAQSAPISSAGGSISQLDQIQSFAKRPYYFDDLVTTYYRHGINKLRFIDLQNDLDLQLQTKCDIQVQQCKICQLDYPLCGNLQRSSQFDLCGQCRYIMEADFFNWRNMHLDR
ncbi:hypothetical protein MIR68_008029 [Amoeboaphelidium protococcarum]|nr:hypothetical protein MIR68_008029 [Amoeboaphelidium protococcarum]